MKKLIAAIAVLLLLVGCSVVQNAADSIQRNFKLQQLAGCTHSLKREREANPMEKYIGRRAEYCGVKLEVVGYSYNE